MDLYQRQFKTQVYHSIIRQLNCNPIAILLLTTSIAIQHLHYQLPSLLTLRGCLSFIGFRDSGDLETHRSPGDPPETWDRNPLETRRALIVNIILYYTFLTVTIILNINKDTTVTNKLLFHTKTVYSDKKISLKCWRPCTETLGDSETRAGDPLSPAGVTPESRWSSTGDRAIKLTN